ncbi:MAG: hypothetical protein LBT08_06415 [Synergistaceae bacterium]|jgi:hypothetical protein|nr:hypothetical protein [Synergistaceae bacterium]
MTVKKNIFCLFVAIIAVSAMLAAASAFACDDCDEPGLVDGDDAYEHSRREGRDPIEGFWGIYIDWHPDAGVSKSFRLAIVENTYDLYPEADYVGVATCDRPGCKKGEIKLLLTKTDVANEFLATLLTEKGGAKGIAVLVGADDGRPESALDLREVKYDGKVMAHWMLRINGG